MVSSDCSTILGEMMDSSVSVDFVQFPKIEIDHIYGFVKLDWSDYINSPFLALSSNVEALSNSSMIAADDFADDSADDSE